MAYTLPATLNLKNMKSVPAIETDLFNTGLAAVATGEALHPTAVLEDCLPVLNTADHAGTIQIPIYGNYNQYFTLKAGEEMTVTVHSDAEAMFYLGMHKPGILEIAEHASMFPEEEADAPDEEGEDESV